MLQQPLSKKLHQKAFHTLSLALACCTLAFTGCQALKSKFSSIPALPTPGLAFWKKESEIAPPPPPALHLNPSPTDGLNAAKTSLARTTDSVDDYQRQIDEIKSGIAATERKFDGAINNNEPLRSPYDTGESKLAEAANGFKSDFKSAGNSIDQRLNQAKELGANSFSSAQQNFNAAVANTKQSLEGGGFKSPGDVLSTKPSTSNNFKNALADVNKKVQSGFNTAANNVGLDKSIAKVNQSLYDMNGKLTTAAGGSSTKSVENTVENTVEAARQRFSSALGPVGNRVAEVARSSTEFGGNLKDKVVSAASELKPTFGGGDNSFKPSFSRATKSVNQEAQNLIGKAKESVAGLGGGFDYPGQQRQATPAPASTSASTFGNIAASQPQPQTFAPSQPANRDNSFGSGSFNRTRVANVTPASNNPPPVSNSATTSGSSTRAGSNGLGSTLTKAWNGGAKQSQLQPIEIGPATTTPGNGLRTASLQSSLPTTPAASTIPAAFDQGYNAMTSHVSEIDIPTKILSGSGSYAPGSVNKVR